MLDWEKVEPPPNHKTEIKERCSHQNHITISEAVKVYPMNVLMGMRLTMGDDYYSDNCEDCGAEFTHGKYLSKIVTERLTNLK